MTIVHIEKISTGLWTTFANFKTELKQVTIVLHCLEQLIEDFQSYFIYNSSIPKNSTHVY